YWADDKGRTFTLDEAALLVGFMPGYPWAGSRTSSCQQIGDVVPPPMSCVIIGVVTGQAWEPQLRTYLRKIYRLSAR
ncbi:DNA cytosine methyltransferase, partial [Planobispora rosea]|uniref:DNA cytosine methyltransferase n=1 Tax=Planobispora rosea TaxID=35762 RepID=UPI001944918C